MCERGREEEEVYVLELVCAFERVRCIWSESVSDWGYGDALKSSG